MNKEKILDKVKSFWVGCKKNADVDSKQTDKAIWKNTAFNVGDKIRSNHTNRYVRYSFRVDCCR